MNCCLQRERESEVWPERIPFNVTWVPLENEKRGIFKIFISIILSFHFFLRVWISDQFPPHPTDYYFFRLFIQSTEDKAAC